MRASVYATMLLAFVLGTPAAAGGLFHTAQAVDPSAPATPAPLPKSPAPAAADQPAAVPAPTSPAQKVVGIAAWNQLIGNSIAGTENGEPLTEYYTADGTAKSMSGSEISQGTWALVGEVVCFKYSDEPKPECYRVEVQGDTATYYDQQGSGTRYQILKGNPKGL
jgi:hypothetical protein